MAAYSFARRTDPRKKRRALAMALIAMTAMLPALAQAADVLRIEIDPQSPRITWLSWNTGGGRSAETNLLRGGQAGRLLVRGKDGPWLAVEPSQAQLTVQQHRDGAAMTVRRLAGSASAGGARLILPFDPRITPVTVLAGKWTQDGAFGLPAILSAPDSGALRLSSTAAISGRMLGDRQKHEADLVLDLPATGAAANDVTIQLNYLHVPPPAGLKDPSRWRVAGAGWLNAIQPSARWGDANRPFSAPAGLLGNNVISDPASCSLWFYADQAFFTPEIDGVALMPMVRRTIEYWIDRRTRPTGEVIGYWDYGGFLDANASPIIASWDYVESTGDRAWLASRIERLEFIAEYLAKRDIDGDGLIEALQSGNYGTLVQPNRSCAWWDALNCGHKDAYTNAIIYRAFRCLADLESKLSRLDEAARFATLADRLKASYVKTLFNERTGCLAWWKSADGTLHDYASPTTNGIAIEYGLVEPEMGRQILDRLWKRMDEAGFQRLDLGVPPMFVPVLQADYLGPQAIGRPEKADGSDTLGQYMNGGITAGQVLHFLNAHYVVGMPERADKVLDAMLSRQAAAGFENGVVDEAGKGIDWTTWDGKPSGYEGYLADSFRFLQAVLLRENSFRDRFYRPLAR